MKKYIIVILIFIYCIIGLSKIDARASEQYEKTIDYRYTFLGYDGNYWWNGAYTNWRRDREFNFTDNNTDTMIMTNRDYNSTTITCVDVISSTDGHYYFKGQKVAGSAGTIMLQNYENDYIYKYSTSQVDTDYTFTFTLDNPATIRYNYTYVEIYAISRADDSYTLKETVDYRRSPSTGQYAYGDSYTYTGSDGYNWKGFCMRVRCQCVNNEVYLDNNMYELWTFTSSLDTFTPEINIGDQLDNINGTLGSIYSSITSGFQSVVGAVGSISTNIINGIKNLFVYDDWEDDIDSIVDSVDIPYVSDIVGAFSSITSTVSNYNPYYRETLRLPNYITESPQYLLSIDLDLSSILGARAFGNYTWLDLVRLGTTFASLGFYYAMIRKILLKLGIDISDVISPIIKGVGNL